MLTNQSALILISAIEKSPSNLNSWELDFVSKIKFLLITPQKISPKQAKCLENIYKTAMGQGQYIKKWNLKK